jgi:hypothetical protein
MTYTKHHIDTDFNIIPGDDIARLKAMGEPIYYMVGKKLVREEADGRKKVREILKISTRHCPYPKF